MCQTRKGLLNSAAYRPDSLWKMYNYSGFLTSNISGNTEIICLCLAQFQINYERKLNCIVLYCIVLLMDK